MKNENIQGARVRESMLKRISVDMVEEEVKSTNNLFVEDDTSAKGIRSITVQGNSKLVRSRTVLQLAFDKKEESKEEKMRREGRPITINSYAIAKACKTSSKQMSETSTRKSTKRTRHLPGRCPRQRMAKYLIVKGGEQ